jgi:hypothetical protein
MNEPRRVIVGILPGGGAETYVREGQADPVAIAIRAAHAELDAARAADERARAAKAADLSRAKGTRGARATRKLRRALRAFGVSI